MLIHQNHAAGEENGSIMVGMFVCLCLASKKPSEREFFVPAGTDLGVKLLSFVGCSVGLHVCRHRQIMQNPTIVGFTHFSQNSS
jgi:hypothetical protein